jgi:hypothetical protein
MDAFKSEPTGEKMGQEGIIISRYHLKEILALREYKNVNYSR